MDFQSDSALAEAYKLIESYRIEEAWGLLDEQLPNDLDNIEIIFALQCCTYWRKILNGLYQFTNFEQGEQLVNSWKNFLVFKEHQKHKSEKVIYAFKKGVFSLALEKYSQSSDEKDEVLHAEICRKQGLCYKKLGSYESALKCLVDANAAQEGQSYIIAEMADCWALCGEEKNAKLLFREAFYIDAQKIEFDFLDSQMINLLIKEVESKGYSGDELQEWVAVYAVLLGVFNYRRQLRSNEVLRLKQGIYALESELKDPSSNGKILTPRLLNRYFWLVDYYVSSKESESKISDVLLRIQVLDEGICKSYKETYF